MIVSEPDREGGTLTSLRSKWRVNFDYGGRQNVCCSPDGSLIATATDFKLVVFRACDGNIDAKYSAAHAHYITHVAFSADGSLIASASQDGTVMVWRAPVLENRHTTRRDSHISSPLRLAGGTSVATTPAGASTGAHKPIQRQHSFEDLSPAHLSRDVEGHRKDEKAHDHVHVRMTRSLQDAVASHLEAMENIRPFVHEP